MSLSPHFTFDTFIQVGDFVLSGYHEKDIIFRVTKIERRFYSQDDIDRYYKNGPIVVGDEFNPLVSIEPIVNLSIRASSKKPKASIKALDGAYLKKVDKQLIMEYIERLKQIQRDFFT